jgi:hypothetical protein
VLRNVFRAKGVIGQFFESASTTSFCDHTINLCRPKIIMQKCNAELKPFVAVQSQQIAWSILHHKDSIL